MSTALGFREIKHGAFNIGVKPIHDGGKLMVIVNSIGMGEPKISHHEAINDEVLIASLSPVFADIRKKLKTILAAQLESLPFLALADGQEDQSGPVSMSIHTVESERESPSLTSGEKYSGRAGSYHFKGMTLETSAIHQNKTDRLWAALLLEGKSLTSNRDSWLKPSINNLRTLIGADSYAQIPMADFCSAANIPVSCAGSIGDLYEQINFDNWTMATQKLGLSFLIYQDA